MPIEANLEDGKRWTFDQEVADSFDDMLARSIPQYDVMRQTVNDVALRYLQPGTDALDLGCSHGEALARLRAELTTDHETLGTRLVGVEIADSMLNAAARRFENDRHVQIVEYDLRGPFPRFPGRNFGVVLAVLSLQFVPIEHRQRIVRGAYQTLNQGGALVVVEKVLGATADLDAFMVARYYATKKANGYTEEQIERKRLALEGVLVPVTAGWNEELLRSAGFSDVDCFWRWMNFAAWVAVKDDG